MTEPARELDPRGYDIDEERRRYGEQMSRSILMGTNRLMRAGRHAFHALPSSGDRCKLCASPLQGPGAA